MKNFPHIISKLWYSPLLLTPQRHAAICQLIESRMARADMPGNEAPQSEPMEVDEIGNVAIIPVHGTIVQYPDQIAMSECGCAMDELNRLIDIAEGDDMIGTVIYDFRTPGGSVTGVPETARKIRNSQKKTIAFTNSECCSGGIYLASQCEKFYGTPSASIGSIGVWCAYMDISRAMQNEGQNMQAISAGKYKLMGAYWKPLSSEEISILQTDVDKIFENFKAAVNAVRPISDDAMGNGLCFDGEEAAARGLTDGCVESMDEILNGLVE